MKLNKIARAFLYPHNAIMIILLPVSTAFLIYSMVFFGSKSAVCVVSYFLATYTLAVWCIRIPDMVRFFKKLKKKNKYIRFWKNNVRFRIKISLYGGLIWNTTYAIFQLGLGFYHSSLWYFSTSGYYICLAVMRFFLAIYTGRHKSSVKMIQEFKRYRACGWIFFILNLMLLVMIAFMVYGSRRVIHNEITTIAMATYTFATFVVAIINVIKYRKYNSPVYSATKIINLAAASVSMLTLEATMLTAFDDGSVSLNSRRLLMGISGGIVSVFIISMAVFMIVFGTKRIRELKSENLS